VPAQKFRAIVFDIGRVLIRVDIHRAMEGLASGLSLSPSEVWTAIEKDPHWPDWQEGRISPRDWYLHMNKRLGSALTLEQYSEAWNRALDPQPIHDDELFKKLGKRYRLALLSNTDPMHVAHMEAQYAFFKSFPVRIYSCTLGASKPNPLMYREALRACRVKAPEAIYVDDLLANVEAAKSLGMAGIHYQSPTQLRTDFQTLGIDF
jgi:putative hydrolase of the HAD superfamily